jgi:hypothetical protein
MADKDFGRKPKFGPVAKKGSPKPPPKNLSSAGLILLRKINPARFQARHAVPFLRTTHFRTSSRVPALVCSKTDEWMKGSRRGGFQTRPRKHTGPKQPKP